MTARFGIYQPVALVCSTIGIVLAMVMLSSLWLWTIHDNPEGLRSFFALSVWTVSVIAICSAFLRTCIAVQLGTCCMMMATLAFENNCVLFRDAATMSIFRYSVSTPYCMIFPVLRGTMVGKKPLGLILVALLSFSAILSQFISAVLFSDTGLAHIPGKRENVSLRYQTQDYKTGFTPTLTQKPVEFPRFAEKTAERFSISGNSSGPGISDTGPTLRAFLPLSETNRSAVLYYHGMATIIDSHVLCVSPKMDQLQFDLKNRSISGNLSAHFLEAALASGRLGTRKSFERNATQFPPFTFKCVYTDFLNETYFCPVSTSRRMRCPGLPIPCLWDDHNYWWMIVQQRFRPASGVYQMDDTFTNAISDLYNAEGYKFNGTEWVTKSVSATTGDIFTAEITLCITVTGNAQAKIEVEADVNATEPQYTITQQTDKKASEYNTTLIQNLLGVNNHDYRERGIFNLTNYTVMGIFGYSNAIDSLWRPSYLPAAHPSTLLQLSQFHPVYQSIFNTTLAETHSAAVAIQAIFTLFIADNYYENLGFFTNYTSSSVQAVQPVIVPTRMKGLYIVSGIVGLHVLLVVVVFWLYFKSSVPRFLDQAWQTVGQLHCGEARELLNNISHLGDREVGNLGPAAAKWETLVEFSTQEKTSINCQTTSYIPLRSLQDGDSRPTSTSLLVRRGISTQSVVTEGMDSDQERVGEAYLGWEGVRDWRL